MKFLVIGSGGREHALCWAIIASPLCDQLYCAPGNAGIADVATIVDIAPDNFDAIEKFCIDTAIDMVIIGPEDPLVGGLSDNLRKKNIRVIGPCQKAAQLEGSKIFMKDMCKKYHIPTAYYESFDCPDAAKKYIKERGAPIVIKADGLAQGKGVIVAMTLDDAHAAVDRLMIDAAFGNAGQKIVVEEFLDGEEISFFALCDGHTALPLVPAQDHKRAFDGDKGPNTGGMGAYSPVPIFNDDLKNDIINNILTPTMKAFEEMNCPYQGILFIGLMVKDNKAKVIEYNIRFGDPEAQVILMRLKSDIVPALFAACDKELSHITLQWHDDAVINIVMASDGYPGAYKKGSIIKNIDMAGDDDVVEIFHAGTKRDENGNICANGGRVLNVVARGATVKSARDAAYRAVEKINWPEGFYRRDIAHHALRLK